MVLKGMLIPWEERPLCGILLGEASYVPQARLLCPYNNAKNFFHHYNLSGHWKTKCWGLHLELHPKNCTVKRGVWGVKIEEDKELLASPVQGAEAIQGAIGAREVSDTNKMDNELMPRKAIVQLLFLILRQKNPFLKMCRRLVHGCSMTLEELLRTS